MTTVERLQDYYDFSQDTLQAVADVADRQRQAGPDYRNVLCALGVPDPEWFVPDDSNAIKILDIKPVGDFDETKARVMHIAMGNDLDPNQIYQAATVAAADPDKRLIVAGNPGAPGYTSGKLSRDERRVVLAGSLRPAVDPVLRYLNEQAITDVQHVGFSYGSKRARAAAMFANAYNQTADQVVDIEPADLLRRHPVKLLIAFASTAAALEHYVGASNDPAFKEARQNSPQMLAYILGLMRLSNLAIGRCIAKGGFEEDVHSLLLANDTTLTVIRGTKSELAPDRLAKAIMGEIIDDWGNRVRDIVLPGQKHNMVNDIHLQAALVREALAV